MYNTSSPYSRLNFNLPRQWQCLWQPQPKENWLALAKCTWRYPSKIIHIRALFACTEICYFSPFAIRRDVLIKGSADLRMLCFGFLHSLGLLHCLYIIHIFGVCVCHCLCFCLFFQFQLKFVIQMKRPHLC